MGKQPQKINQTIRGTIGNCFSACVAMVLGRPLELVPNFAHIYEKLSNEDYHKAVRQWFNNEGFDLWHNEVENWKDWKKFIHPDHYIIVLVASDIKGGFTHAVVFKGAKLFHDPFPKNKLGKILGIYTIMPLELFQS